MSDEPVVCEVAIRAPAEAVYAMFTDPAKLVRWIGIRALLEGLPKGEPHKISRPSGPPSTWPELLTSARRAA